MSKQIQSLLNQIDEKFEASFNQSIHEQFSSKELNPQSSKKTVIKNIESNDQQTGNFNEIKILLLQQITDIGHLRRDSDTKPFSNFEEPDYLEHLQIESVSNRKQSTPNFKYKQESDKYDVYNLKKTISQQQYCKFNFQKSELNEDNPYYYKELTIKLQKALLKISSEKDVKIKKSYNFYDRVQQFQENKIKQINRKKQQIQQNSIKELKDRPVINSYSRNLVAQINNDPIYIRCDQIIQKKKEKQANLEQIKRQKEQKEYQKFKEQFNFYINEVKQKYKAKGIRSVDQYYHEQQNWMKMKEKNIESRQALQKQRMDSHLTFKPLINSKSQKIIQSKKEEKRTPIYNRQPKIKQLHKDLNCTFQPKINKTNFQKKTSYYQAPF